MRIVRKKRSKNQLPVKTEITQETFELIEKIAEEHSNNPFGYLDKDDIKGEIWAICLEVISEYDSSSGKLEHFLRVSVKNRLVNKFKEITKSVRSPCNRCPYFDIGTKTDCSKFKHSGTQSEPGPNRDSCDKWKNYQLSIQSRNSLLNATETVFEQEIYTDPTSGMVTEELTDLLRRVLPDWAKEDFENVLRGTQIPKQNHDKLKAAVIKAIEENTEDIDG